MSTRAVFAVKCVARSPRRSRGRPRAYFHHGGRARAYLSAPSRDRDRGVGSVDRDARATLEMVRCTRRL